MDNKQSKTTTMKKQTAITILYALVVFLSLTSCACIPLAYVYPARFILFFGGIFLGTIGAIFFAILAGNLERDLREKKTFK